MGSDRSIDQSSSRPGAFKPGRRAPLLAALLLAVLATAAGAQPPRWNAAPGPQRGPVPEDEVLIRNGAVIGEIYVQTGNIFDPEEPGEDKLLFQIANRLHVTTRPSVVERKLLFKPGDPYSPRILHETARLLRAYDFLYDAWIEPIRYHDNRVDVLVRTRDVWTLSAGAGYERSGGENTLQFSLRESNFLGSGRFLDVKFSDDPDRSSQRFRFVDHALFDSRAELKLWYADNSDGHRRIFDLARPFFSLDTRWSGGVMLVSDDRLEKTYSLGEVVNRFFHETTRAEVRGGISKGYRKGRARRWLAGYTFERDRFRDEDYGIAATDRPPTGSLPIGLPGGAIPFPREPADPFATKESLYVPRDRTLSYLWIGYEEVEDRFIETHNMDQLQRTEDFNLGLEVRARLGFSSVAFGADKDQAIFEAGVTSGWAPRADHTVLWSGYASGRWGAEDHEDVRVGGELRYFWRNFGRHRLLATIAADAAWNLDPENQLLLGGDSGLRGYPLRFQDGDRRFLVSLEQRFYTNWELFHLVHVGAAVFADAGRAWYDVDLGQPEDLGMLTDVGFGLRLSSSRSSSGQMVHLDVAFPLDRGSDEVQWLVTSRQSF